MQLFLHPNSDAVQSYKLTLVSFAAIDRIEAAQQLHFVCTEQFAWPKTL
jgi:hypothetical protein